MGVTAELRVDARTSLPPCPELLHVLAWPEEVVNHHGDDAGDAGVAHGAHVVEVKLLKQGEATVTEGRVVWAAEEGVPQVVKEVGPEAEYGHKIPHSAATHTHRDDENSRKQ